MFTRTVVSLEIRNIVEMKRRREQMALRKEEYYYDPHEERKSMDKAKTSKQRITIEVSSELNDLIAAAAEEQKLSINQYLENVLGEIMPLHRMKQRDRKPINKEAVEKLRQFQAQLLQERDGEPFDDSVNLLREAREEREKELGL
jgi:predicted HicB family RNase H-like nuclease